MATIVPYTSQVYVNALLGVGPHWNSLPAHNNTLRYSFAVTGAFGEHVSSAQAFSPTQQANARTAFAYISELTGIQFVETADPAAAQVYLACGDIAEPDAAGLCVVSTSGIADGAANDYTASASIFIDNDEWLSYAGQLVPGTEGYELLLHELGHMLGLKHPFAGVEGNGWTLSEWDDHTANTLMSYTRQGGPYSVYSQYDISALMWLYGGDGLDGRLGLGGTTGYWMGTSAIDVLHGNGLDNVLQGGGGDDSIDGSNDNDTAVYLGPRDAYEFVELGYKVVRVKDLVGHEGTDWVTDVELFQFSDGIFTYAQVTNADVTPPPAPVFGIEVAPGGLVTISGTAEPNAFIDVYFSWGGDRFPFTSTQADASGAWSLMPLFVDNHAYVFYASATDAAHNVSAFAEQQLVVNEVSPAVPTLNIEQDGNGLIGGTRPVFYGTAHPGSTVEVIAAEMVVATAIADAKGHWEAVGREMYRGVFFTTMVATTPEGRPVYSAAPGGFRVDPATSVGGTDAGDLFTAREGNTIYGGGTGADTMAYAGTQAAYTVAIGERGVTVIDTLGGGGTDTLFSVERLQFGDTHVAVDIRGNGGQAYRIYQAVFDRAPDLAGVGYWMARMDAGVALTTVALGFMQSPEFVALYGTDPTNEAFVAKLYLNVLDRAGEQEGFDFWVAGLNEGRTDRASVLVHFSESAENVDNVAEVIGNGFPYLPPG